MELLFCLFFCNFRLVEVVQNDKEAKGGAITDDNRYKFY